jgi:hypothetical protein
MDVRLDISRTTGWSLFNSVFWSSSIRGRFLVNLNVPPPKLRALQMDHKTQSDVFLRERLQRFRLHFRYLWRPYPQTKLNRWYHQEYDAMRNWGPKAKCEFSRNRLY